MSAVIGALRAELSASIAKFQDDMNLAAQSVRKFSRDMEKQGAALERVGARMSIALTAPLVAFGIKAVAQGKEAAQALGQVQAALESTGGRSGKTAAQLEESAEALQKISTFDKAEILGKVSASMLRFGNISGKVFDDAQKAAVNLAARMGIDLQSAATLVGKALNQPTTGLQALNRAGVAFTKTQKDLIASLIASGRGAEAQGIILGELKRQFEGAAEAARKNDPFAVLRQSMNDLAEAAGPLIVAAIQPVIDMLKGLADVFAALSPAMQATIVDVGLVVAALGPLLVLVGNLMKVVGFLTPLLVPLGAAIAAVSLPIWGLVAAFAAAVAAIVIFWKSIQDILHGDFTKAWEDAKVTAANMWKDLQGMFKAKPIQAAIEFTPAGSAKFKSATGPAGGAAPQFDLPKEMVSATKTFTDALRGMDTKIAGAFDNLQLPKSVATARDLNAQIDEMVVKAKEAGVNTGAFAGHVDELRASIENLKQAGLAKEAEKFGREVDKNSLSVQRFAQGSLDPLAERLSQVDTAYEGLRNQITAQIEDNAKLADVSAEAAQSMERLKGQLMALETAHGLAADAARAQWQAEKKIADLQSAGEQMHTAQEIQDLQQARGLGGPVGSDQARLQDIGRQLAEQQLRSEQKLAELSAQRLEAERVGDVDALDRLNREISLQTQLHDLITSTTAEQIQSAERVNRAFSDFADSLATQLTDMVTTWTFDLKGLQSVFRDLAKQLFIQPATSGLSAGLAGFMKDAFAGAHAFGGFIPPGQWGTVGERGEEPAFGGRMGLSIMGRDQMGRAGPTIVQNIQTPDLASFRLSARQLARQAKQRIMV